MSKTLLKSIESAEIDIEQYGPYVQIVDKRLEGADWAFNTLMKLSALKAKGTLKNLMINMSIYIARGIPKVRLDVMVTSKDAVQDKEHLSKVIQTLQCGKLSKQSTSQGFTKLVGWNKGVKVNVFTKWCFDRKHVKLVRKRKRTEAVTTCMTKEEALKLAQANGYIIE